MDARRPLGKQLEFGYSSDETRRFVDYDEEENKKSSSSGTERVCERGETLNAIMQV